MSVLADDGSFQTHSRLIEEASLLSHNLTSQNIELQNNTLPVTNHKPLTNTPFHNFFSPFTVAHFKQSDEIRFWNWIWLHETVVHKKAIMNVNYVRVCVRVCTYINYTVTEVKWDFSAIVGYDQWRGGWGLYSGCSQSPFVKSVH